MAEEGKEMDQQSNRSVAARLRTYRIRMLLLDFVVLMLFLLAGLAMSFYQWDRGSPFDTSTWDGHFNPISRATYGPVVFTLFIFPISLPALVILALPVYFGLKKQSRWPMALFPFVVMGVLWMLWLNGLWQMD